MRKDSGAVLKESDFVETRDGVLLGFVGESESF
jgi:hypothetical protein